MRVRWTASAARDLEQILDYVAPDSPASAHRIGEAILERISSLATLPSRGRRGRVAGTRELVFARLPFVAVYQVHDEVQVLRILHGARQWPPS